MRKTKKYFRGVAEEAHRIRWPSAKDLWRSVGIVLGITIICCLVLVLADYLTYQIIHAFSANIPSSASSSAVAAVAESAIVFIGGLVR